jgi:L-fucose mutarotase
MCVVDRVACGEPAGGSTARIRSPKKECAVLKGIDPLLSGELLKILDDMGHGDELLLVDRNFPAAATGRPVVRLGEVGVVRAMRALVSVLPLDEFVERPLERMEVDGDPDRTTPEQDAVLELARRSHPLPLEWGVVPRLRFYERSRSAYAVVHTLEPHAWGCFILTKGVVFPD